jgi:nicotinate-nucleotide adenylyltransferase
MVGLFGGTFDPIHLAHLRLAEEAKEEFKLERVFFLPAGVPPHKAGWKISPYQDRFEMTLLAIQGNPAFEVESLEAERPGASYSVDTVKMMKARYQELAFLMGADQLLEIRSWKDPRELFDLCRVIVFDRPGFDLSALERMGPEVRALNYLKARTGLYPVSSSDIRGKIRAGKSVRYLVPEAVHEYLLTRRLYQSPE